MKIAAYCRVSTEKEAQIDSLEKQIIYQNGEDAENKDANNNEKNSTRYEK